MSQTTQIKTNRVSAPQVLYDILDEIRLLRNQLSLLLPSEDLKDYAHPSRIKRSYQNAIKRYPPVSL